MIKYLLLRNNKQSGPYTLEELRTKGLKAYDLVWIEGKSAAWRYPSEVAELKVFAPIVEEQPFDRFYKKPIPEVHPIFAVPKEPKPEKEISAENSISHPLVSSVTKNVYVTLPVSRPGTPTPEIEKQFPERENDRRFLPQVETGIPAKPEQAPIAENKPGRRFVEDNFVLTEEKISQSTEQKYHRNEEKNTQPYAVLRSRKKLVNIFVFGIGIVALLMAGVLIGMYIDKPATANITKTAGKVPAVADKPTPGLQKKDSVVPIVNNSVQQVNSTGEKPTTETARNSVETSANTADQLKGKSVTIETEKKKPASLKSRQDDISIPAKVAPVKDSSESYLSVQKRESSHRIDATVDKDAVRTNISNYVSTSVNKFSVGTFGGIDNLQITVNNRSLYPLDMVVVEVQYIQANKKVFKTENIYFRNIGAGSALMQEAPKSSRGVKIEYKITLIDSKELGLSYSGI